jgi:hypothetical protein
VFEANFCRLKMGIMLMLFMMPVGAAVWVQHVNEQFAALGRPLPGLVQAEQASDASLDVNEKPDPTGSGS